MKTVQGKLKLGEIIPYFSLPSSRNEHISLWDFKQKKNLVIFFNHGITCSRCTSKLKELAPNYAKFVEHEAEILAVSFDIVEKLKTYAAEQKLPFHLLSDETGKTTHEFTSTDAERNAPSPSFLITDRFGVLRHQEIASEARELLDADEILSWLLLIQLECPECSHL